MILTHSEVEPQGGCLVAGSALTSLQVRDPALLNSLTTAPGPPAYLCPPPPLTSHPRMLALVLFAVALGKGFHHQTGSLSLISLISVTSSWKTVGEADKGHMKRSRIYVPQWESEQGVKASEWAEMRLLADCCVESELLRCQSWPQRIGLNLPEPLFALICQSGIV